MLRNVGNRLHDVYPINLGSQLLRDVDNHLQNYMSPYISQKTKTHISTHREHLTRSLLSSPMPPD